MRWFKLAVTAAASAVLAVACTTTRLDIPALPGEGTTPGKIVWHDLITDTPEASRAFYSALFGWEFKALGGINYEVIYHQGQPIGGLVDQTRLPLQADISQWVAVLSVADIDTATAQFRAAGGTVFTPPTSLGSRGRLAVVADPQGAVLALLESGGHDPADSSAVPSSGNFLWNELWTGDVTRAGDFYSTLAPYSDTTRDLEFRGQRVDYEILSSAGQPRLGIRNNPITQLPPQWVSYLRVADAQQLQDLLARVESLGGKVLVPATARPAGGEVAVIADPSGAGIALQTWPLGAQTADLETAQ
ncbi:VOC family protein [Haliea sp. E17]|uniref:VOC family protein n=1 Tax=Haliea sp. E17 TaxID=3401576 RepID=UPI003AADC1BE